MNNVCAVKDICSDVPLVLGDVLEKDKGLILVDIVYTVAGPFMRIYDIFGDSEIVPTRQIKRRKLWFRKKDVIFPL